MSNQIIQQPDGKFAVWSTVVDDFTLLDAKPSEIIEYFLEAEREVLTPRVQDICYRLSLQNGSKPYHQFTMSWEEACALRDRIHARRQKK